MKENIGNILDAASDYDAICISTNGVLCRDGAAVMGRGVALAASRKWPGLDSILGRHIKKNGNHVACLTELDGDVSHLPPPVDEIVPWRIYSVPVKKDWRDRADLVLIRQSLEELRDQTQGLRVLLPRLGCGAGERKWSEVKPIIEEVLCDLRFEIMDLKDPAFEEKPLPARTFRAPEFKSRSSR